MSAPTGRVALATGTIMALVCVGLAWALASPVASSPDDDFHLATIWCDAGDPDLCRRTGREVEEGVEEVLVVPELGPDMPCFFMRPDLSAGCQAEVVAAAGFVTGRANDGLYPGGFYRLLSVFAGDDVGRSVVAMRMASWLVVLGLLIAAFVLASGRLRLAFALAALTTLVPLGVFLFASTNPSGLTVAGVAAYWCAAMTFMDADRARGRRAVLVVALAVVSSLAALVSRADAGLFLAVASVAVWVFTGGHLPGLRRRSLLLAVVAVVGVAAALRATQSRRWAGELGVQEGNSLTAKVFEGMLDVPRRVLGSLGLVELGWLDTPMPALTSALMLLAFGGAVVLGVGVASRRKWLALAVVAGTLVALPVLVLTSGQNAHPRYLLPLLPVLAGTALAVAPGGPAPTIGRGQALLLLSAVVVAHGAALHKTIRRYVTGVDEGGPELGENAEWWWSSGPGPTTTWLLGSLAFAVAVLCGALLLRAQVSANRVGASSSSSEPAKS